VRLVLLGPPGAGKGTQGDLLGRRLGILRISTGQLLRSQADAGTPLGIQARPYLDSGTLVPDEVIIGVVADRLAQPDTASGFILDGFPRTVRQAHDLAALLSDGRALDRVVELRLDRVEIVRRLAGRRTCSGCGRVWHLSFDPPVNGRCGDCGADLVQRTDDQPATIEHRLDVYDRQTAPLVEHYRGTGLLVTVDAAGPVESVLAATVTALQSGASVAGQAEAVRVS
jgi:adenylate kinase